MVRACTSASGDQEPIPTPASGTTIQGRGTGRGQGQGRGLCRGGCTSSESTQYYCHLVLQDTLTHMLGLLEGMAQAGTLSIISNASPTRVRDSQTPRTHPTTVVASCLDGMELPSIVSHLANRPSMTIDEQKMFGWYRIKNPPTYTGD
ncbi:hypothetical protein R3W88_014610 [Solanum pinnatisectum]|uniref:Uncharacterized protein n=1 Tax=Solanum pinnatisectum TaxID=50273 RepID=A0AAV9KS89_9SOLN|nr:hypothetical protein R3W88_014610 [Solanum pinnatisectum]